VIEISKRELLLKK